jgi:hypothetical protein
MNPDILEKIVNKVLEGFEHHDDENDALNNI